MRVDQFISQAMNISRQDAKRLLRSGQITCAGQPIQSPKTHIDMSQAIKYQETHLTLQKHQFWVLNKPMNYCCSHRDDGYPSILHLLPKVQGKKLYIAGRLDADTTGLVLLSSDGAWCHRVTSPKQKRLKSKHYFLTLSQPLTKIDKLKLMGGVLLHGDEKPTLPCEISPFENGYRITLHQGKYHQIKRMFGSLGYRVISLHRFQLGIINLEGIPEGQCRELTKDEVDFF